MRIIVTFSLSRYYRFDEPDSLFVIFKTIGIFTLAGTVEVRELDMFVQNKFIKGPHGCKIDDSKPLAFPWDLSVISNAAIPCYVWSSTGIRSMISTNNIVSKPVR